MKDEKDEKNDEDTYDVIPSSPISHFDSRPLTRVTASFTLQMHTPCNFNSLQSTPPCGGDRSGAIAPMDSLPFQSTPPRGGDVFTKGCGQYVRVFSIHAPMRGRRSLPLTSKLYVDFNPHPHTGATVFLFYHIQLFSISIHTPIRGRRNSA